MRFIFVIIVPLLFCYCNNQSKEPVNDDLKEIIEEEEAVSPFNFSKSFPELNKFLHESDSSFSPGKFSLPEEMQTDSTKWNDVDPGTLEEFHPYLILNADSSQALDLVSYNFIVTNRKDVQLLEFAGPDTEIGLIDLKTKTRKRILFLGSAGMVLDGKWDENGNIIIAGAQDAGNGTLQPVLWRIYPEENRMETSTYPETINVNVSEFYKEKYKPFKTIRVV